MSRSLFIRLHRRFGEKLSGAEMVKRALDKQAEFISSTGLATTPPDCSPFFPNGVAIVGGGFAGLAAGWMLSVSRIRSTIFEARDTIGGRVETNKTLIPGRLLEYGAELIGLDHPMWLMLAKMYGLGLIVLTGEDQYAGAGLELQIRFRGKAVTDLEKLHNQMRFVLRKISSDAKAVTDPFAPWTAPNAGALDARTVADKIAEYSRLVPGTRHPSLVDAIEFELGNDHVLPTKEQSYLGLLAVVSGGRLGKDDVHLDGYWTHREDFKCAEGNVSLIGEMLERGRGMFQVKASSPVKKIEISETEPRVKVTWLDPIKGLQSRDFNAVILAVPPSVWHKITITPPLPAGREMGLGGAVKYISRVNGRFWIRSGTAPNSLSDELGQTWEATENQQIAREGIALTVFAGGQFVPGVDAKKHFQSQILKLYPDYKMTTDHYADWPKTEWIETGYSCPKVGQVTTIGKFLSVPHSKRLFFAGEHTCLAYFGYMEGAMQSGVRAAIRVVASCMKEAAAPAGQIRTPRQLPVREEETVFVSVGGSRRESETFFLHGLLRELGHDPVADMSPVAMFRAALRNRPLINDAQDLLRVVAVPSQQSRNSLRAGDWMVRAVPGSGDIGHVSVLTSDALLTQSMLVSRGIRSESVQPGYYGLVLEAGAFPHDRSEPYARRLLNSRGCVPPNTVFLRPAFSNGGSPVVEEDLTEDLTYEEILERLKQELNLPFSDPNDPGLLARRRRLRDLFTSVPAPRTRELHGRLGATPTGDALSRLFHYKLATPTRRELLKILEDRFPPATTPAPTRPPAPTTTPHPCQRAMGSMRQLLPWERSFLALIHDKSESDFRGVAILVGPIILPGLMPYPMDAIVRLALQQNNAITIENNVWFPRAIDTSTVGDLVWLVHESVHVVDYAVAGTEAFLKTYIQQAIVHGFKHDDIPHEIRANNLEAAARAMLNRFPDLVTAIGSCDGIAIMTLLANRRNDFRAGLHESIAEEDSLSEAPRPDPGRVYNCVRDLLKLPSTDNSGFKKIIDSCFLPKAASCGKSDVPSKKKCSYSAFIAGEWSHNRSGEQDLALDMIDYVAGLFPSGTFALREETTTMGDGSLGPGILTGAAATAAVTKRRGITVVGLPAQDQYRSQRWAPDLVKGAKKLITYTGSAHTSKEFTELLKKMLPSFDTSAGKPILDSVRDTDRRGLVLDINLADEIMKVLEEQAYREKLREFPDPLMFENWLAAFTFDWAALFKSFSATTIFKIDEDVYWALIPPYSGITLDKTIQIAWADKRVSDKIRADKSWTLYDISKNKLRFEDDKKKGKHFLAVEVDVDKKKVVRAPAEENY